MEILFLACAAVAVVSGHLYQVSKAAWEHTVAQSDITGESDKAAQLPLGHNLNTRAARPHSLCVLTLSFNGPRLFSLHHGES